MKQKWEEIKNLLNYALLIGRVAAKGPLCEPPDRAVGLEHRSSSGLSCRPEGECVRRRVSRLPLHRCRWRQRGEQGPHGIIVNLLWDCCYGLPFKTYRKCVLKILLTLFK